MRHRNAIHIPELYFGASDFIFYNFTGILLIFMQIPFYLIDEKPNISESAFQEKPGLKNYAMNRSNKIILLALLLLLPLTLYAQYRTNVHSISRREGLSNGAVNSIIKDAEGYIWFGTWNGLDRYDGNSIITYLPGNNSNSIHNHVIRELYPSKSGPIWILTNKGVSRYDNIHDRFTSYFNSESEKINYDNDIAISYSDSYGTLVSIYGQGIFSFDSISGEFRKISFDENSVSFSTNIKRIHLLDTSAYCISKQGEIFSFSENHLKEILQLPLRGTITSSTSVQIDHHPYILITQQSGAALIADLDAKTVQQLSLPDEIISSFALSKTQNRIWAGTEKGKVYSFNLLNHNFELFNVLAGLFITNPISTRIISIFESETNILWIGTDGNGIYTLKLTEFPNKSLSSNQLAYPIVRSILVTRNRDVLIGTKGGGIDVFNSSGNHVRDISVKNGLSNNSVLALREQEDGSIWVGTDGEGIDILSPDYKKIRNFPRDFKGVDKLNFASVYNIFIDSDHQVYLGTSGYGVIRVDLDKQRNSVPIGCESLILDKTIAKPEQQKQIVYAITEEKPGIIWIGTRGLGVYRYNTITKRVIAQYSTLTHPNFIKNDDILSLFTTKDGLIWIGSSNGIFSINPFSADSVRSESMSTTADLQNNSVHIIQTDNTGNLWITTNKGLSLIDKASMSVRSFNTNDGLINFEYSDGASFYDQKTDRLYIGGTMGVDIVQTSEIKFSSYFPPIAVNQLLIKNLPIEPGPHSILESRINYQNKLRLNYSQNSLTFYVSALAYWGQERHRISYRMKEIDNEWTINPINQPLAFSNLPSGKYKLQLRVSDENGNWSKQIREIDIIVDPPFWRTSWAIAVYILLFVGIQLIVVQSYRRREAGKKEAVLKEFQKQKDAELQSYKIEFFTNVAHEFRTPLTLISSHIHALIEDAQASVVNPRLLKIFNNSIKLQKLVFEIMQFRRLEKGKEPLNIQLTKPVELLAEVVSDFELLAQQRNVRCELIAPDEEITFLTDADKFQRIVTNLISNAIKYNKPGGFVSAFIKLENSALIVEIEDNGIGVKPEYIEKVFEPFGISQAKVKGSFPAHRSTGLGLAVTKGLVELLKGTINFESTPGEGAKFICRFPDVQVVSSNLMQNEPAEELRKVSYIEESWPDKPLDTSARSTGKPLILLVDDESEILELLRDFLKADYNIMFSGNGLEAYNKVLTEKPDLIVSDVMMPEMDGIELCNKLRENFDTSHLPLILLTAKAEIEDRIAGLKAGADSYIPKPFHPEHLKVRIEKLLQLRSGIKKHFGKQDENPVLVKEIPDPFFQTLMNFINENIDDETLSSEKLCEKFAISKSSLYNKTKSVLGITPHSLIYQRRLSKAATLLKSTTMTVSEIIDQTGFTSRTHFYELFNKAYGCSPSDYRGKELLN